MIPFVAGMLSAACAAGVPVRTAAVRPGEEVVLSDGGALREWIELSCPREIIRGGRAVAAVLPVRTRVPGAYLIESRPSALAGANPADLASRVLHEIRVEGPLDASAAILAEHVQGAGDEVTLVLHAFAGEVLDARWRLLSSPAGHVGTSRSGLGAPAIHVGASRSGLDAPAIHVGASRSGLDAPAARTDARRFSRHPAETSGAGAAVQAARITAALPGRYRISAAARTAAGWTAWAVLSFEVPAGADGRGVARPKAVIAAPTIAATGEEVVLDGSASEGSRALGELLYLWTQVSGAPVRLESEGAFARFLACVPGRYEFALSVGSAIGLSSAPAKCAVVVEAPEGGGRPPEPDAPDPLDRPLSVELRDEPVSALLARLSEIGVTVRAAPDVSRDGPFDAVRMDLWTVEVPARRVLDWLGRILDAHYVVESPGAVWFSRRGDWIEREELDARTYRVDALFADKDGADLVALLSEAVLPATWANALAAVGPLDVGKGTLTAILPRSAHERLARVIAELRRPLASGPPSPRTYLPVQRLLAREVTTRHSGWSFRDAAWDLARQARVTIGFMPQGAWGGPRVTLSGGRMPLSQALGQLAREGGVDGFAVEPDGLIWLCRGVRPPVSSECLWTSAEVRSYDVSRLKAAHGFSGPMILRLVKSRVYPERWRNPFVMGAFSAARERLVIIHSEEVQRGVGDLMERIFALGEKALGEAKTDGGGTAGDGRD
jgi:hypothetical protein